MHESIYAFALFGKLNIYWTNTSVQRRFLKAVPGFLANVSNGIKDFHKQKVGLVPEEGLKRKKKPLHRRLRVAALAIIFIAITEKEFECSGTRIIG